MRKQIAAANWKMNCTYQEGEALLTGILDNESLKGEHQQVIFAVPALYISMALEKTKGKERNYIAAQNCHHKSSGAYTGEISASMLRSMGVPYCIIGHSERREYFHETDEMLAEKTNLLLKEGITPVFCCGEPLQIREKEGQNDYVAKQLKNALFHLSAEEISKIIIAYEPIWAIGTGKTATAEQAQQMHRHIRNTLAKQYSPTVADSISILYGGSVKPDNAAEIFGQPDVDGGLVGGASLSVDDFTAVIKALK